MSSHTIPLTRLSPPNYDRNATTAHERKAINLLHALDHPVEKLSELIRFFLTCCLVRDYGLEGYQNNYFRLSPSQWRYLREVAKMKTSFAYTTSHQNKYWKDYFERAYSQPVTIVGVPLEIATNMLLTYHWRSVFQDSDRHLHYRNYMRGIPDVAEKLYFDRELVIDLVVESHDLRMMLKERLSSVQEMWFQQLNGPREVDYALSSFGMRHKEAFPQPWKTKVKHWSGADKSTVWKLRYMCGSWVEHQRRLRAQERKLPLGTPKPYWPQKFLPEMCDASLESHIGQRCTFTSVHNEGRVIAETEY